MSSYHMFHTSFHFLTFPCTKPPPPPLNIHLFLSLRSNTKTTFLSSSLNDDSFSNPKSNQFGYGSSEDLFGLEVEFKPRKANSHLREPRSWFGPNGQYIRELPCPSCRGRGYTPCTECGIERSRSDCPKCNGKGLLTCNQCSGDCVIWEESIDERPWERARSISPLKVKEDDEVDKLEIKLDAKKKSKRVYQSPSPEVGLKISRSLKKAKRTVSARKHASKTMKAYFSDPINRQKRSVAMKGVKFYCHNCGREGHRRNYCPELNGLIDRRFTCKLCGEKGHNRKTCIKSKISQSDESFKRHRRCRICRRYGHNRQTCPQVVSNPIKATRREGHRRNYFPKLKDGLVDRRFTCKLCGGKGHIKKTCIKLRISHIDGRVIKHRRCRVCRQYGHNRQTCPQVVSNQRMATASRKVYHCRLCRKEGHNSRRCPRRIVGTEQSQE
ncbi:uncharacterized protein [Cicer arietinum]|uniref:DNA-binding protein HEXBP isoform X2 n=1 Tax=Cicer arietinum TaxID=3827 RepID=A0A1S2Z481_CICAR|nr:DNA-binding protein HEXBP isoform X2 [Cicer arietinum]